MSTPCETPPQRRWLRRLACCLALPLAACAIRVAPVEPGAPLGQAPLLHPAAIEEAHRFLATQTAFDAFVAMAGEREITRWGEADLPINTHSVRKSLLGALVGIAVERGLMRLDDTLATLGIDEPATPLTAVERSATVRQLLQSRSGVYLQAAGETQAMRDGRPQRGQFAPGAHFYYNNWDFNVLGAIFEARTGLGIGQALHDWIAVPTGMRSFRPEHVIYRDAERSRYRQFVIFMSASDLARFGALFAQQGRWQGRQVVPAEWVEAGLAPQARLSGPPPFDGYGLLWWLDGRSGTAWADGWRGQYLLVDRARGLAVVSRNDTGRNALSIAWAVAFGKDGLRDHHQHLWRLMIEATSARVGEIAPAAPTRMRTDSGAPAPGTR